MRLIMIGDVVGKPGVKITTQCLPGLKLREQIDLAVVNAENAADGSGLTPELYQALIRRGADCITLGDHIYRRREICEVLEREARIVRPANFPPDAPGRRWTVVDTPHGVSVGVISLLGRVFMRPVDCPWQAVDQVLADIPASVTVRLVDFHAEATSDKQLMGRYLDGRVSAVLGTHTHVTTADEQIFPQGTAFQCDVGMTGPHESILGRKIEKVMQTTLTFRPTHFQVARGDPRLSATLLDIDEATGKATGIRRLSIGAAEAAELEKLAPR